MWIIEYIAVGLIYYFLWINNVFDVIIRLFKNETIGILMVISVIDVIVFLVIKLFKKYLRLAVKSKWYQLIIGIAISISSFFCIFVIDFILSMRTM